MANKTKPKTIEDVLLHHESDEFNFYSGTVKMPASGTPHTMSQVAGMPATWDQANERATLVLNAAISTTTALVLMGPAVSAAANDAENAAQQYTILTNFSNVVINKNGLPLTDSAGTTITLATLVSQLEALGAKVLADPTKVATQTT